jgi:GAF domain-containing protein/CheY-like chemotaxis protein
VRGGPGADAINLDMDFQGLLDGLSGWVLREREPALSFKEVPDSRESPGVREARVRDGVGSVIVVPLRYQEQALGTLTAINRLDQPDFTQEDVDLMMAMANQVAVAIDNTRLFGELQHRARSMQTAAEVSRAASSILSLDALLSQAVDLIRDRFDLYYAGIFLVDEAGEWAELQAGTGEAGEKMLTAEHRLAVAGDSMIGSCVATAEPRIALDVVEEEQQRYANPYLPDTRSEMALPLVSRGDVIGAMTIQSEARAAFSEADITILQTMADQLANAIENARLFERSRELLDETETLYRASRAIGTAQSIEEIAEAILDTVGFLELGGVTIRVVTAWDLDHRPTQIDAYAASDAGETREVRVVRDVPAIGVGPLVADPNAFITFADVADPDEPIPERAREQMLALGYRSALTTGLAPRGRLIGFLSLSSAEPLGALPERYVRVVVRALADQVAVALDNLLLGEQTRRRAEQLEALSIIDSALSETNTEDEILDAVVLAVEIEATLEAWLLYAEMTDEGPTRYRIVASWGDGSVRTDDPWLGEVVTPATMPLAALWETFPDETWFLSDVAADDRVDGTTVEVGAAVLMPLATGGQRQGLILLTWDEPREFTSAEQFMIPRLMRPASALVARRRAYLAEEAARAENEMRARRFQTAAEVAQAATSIIDLEQLLPQAVDLIQERFDLYYAGIFLVDEAGEWVELRAGTGEPGREMLAQKHRFKVGSDSMIGQCVAQGMPQIPEDIDRAVRFVNPLLPETTAEIALPLSSRGQVIGAMSIQSNKVRRFSETDLTILQTVSDQLANALQNAQMFDRMNAALMESETLHDISLAISEAQTVGDMVRAAGNVAEFIGMEGVSLRQFTHWDQFGHPLTLDVYGLTFSDAGPEFVHETDVPFSQQILDWFFTKPQRIHIFPDLQADGSELPEPLRASLVRQNRRSFVSAVLRARGRPLGLLALYSRTSMTQQQPERQVEVFVRTLVDQLSTSLDRRALREELERRAERLVTASEVSRSTSSILDQDTLLSETVELIRTRFDLYYVGIFLLDDSGTWAVLRAGSGEAGRAMLAEGHRLLVGGESMIGNCVATGEADIRLDVGEGAGRFDNPYLPDTRSEMALPLISRGDVIGAMSIQSEEVAAYSEEDIAILQTMADQLANAIGNARLYAQSQANLEELQRVQQRYMLDTWDGYVERQDVLGYTYDLNELQELPPSAMTDIPPEAWEGRPLLKSDASGGDGATLFLPFDVREEPVGVMSLEGPAVDEAWSEDEMAVLDAVRDQLALALENRLLIDQSQNALQEAQQREREVRFLQEVATFLNATDNVVSSQGELMDRLQAFIPVDLVSLAGYDASSGSLRFLDVQITSPSMYDDWSKMDLSGDTAYAWVVEHDEPLVEDDLRRTSRFEEDARLEDAGIVSRAVLPLKMGVRTLGALGLGSQEVAAFQRADLMPILQQVAVQVASAMQRTELLRQAQASAGESRTLYEATSALAKANQYSSLLRAIVEHTIVLESARAELGLYVTDPESGETQAWVEIVAAWSSGADLEAAPVGQRVRVDELPGLQILESDTLLICEDVSSDPRLTEEIRAHYQAQGVEAFIIAPLSTRVAMGGDIGFFQIRFSEPYHPDSQDVRLYNTIAEQAVVVLYNQQLLEDSQARTRQLESAVGFANVTSAISEREDLLAQAVNFFRERFELYHVGVFLLDAAGEWAVLQAGSGEAGRTLLQMGHRLQVGGKSLVGWCAANNRSRVVLDVEDESLYFPNPLLPDTRSMIVFPLMSRGQLIGVLDIRSDRRFAFTENEVSTLELMATQLANMVESANLYERSQSSLAETRMLYRISQDITNAGTVEDILKAAIEGLSQRTEPDWIAAGLLEPVNEPTMLRMVATWNREGAPIPFDTYPLDKMGHLYESLREDGRFTTPDITQEPMIDEFVRTLYTQLELRATAAFQLAVRDVQYGTLLIHNHKSREFSNAELRFYEGVARQASVALQNQTLVATTQAQAERRAILNEVLRIASTSLDIVVLMRDVSEVIARRFDMPVMMWRWDGRALKSVAVHDAGGALIAGADEGPGFSPGSVPVIYETIATRDPVYISFGDERSRMRAGVTAPFEHRLEEGYAVPLTGRDTVFGVLMLGRQEGHERLSEPEKEFARTAGINIGVALETVRLYQEAQETAEKLQEVDRLKNQFIANMSHELRTPLNSIIGFSRVILKGIDGPLTDMQQTDLEAIHESGKHLLDLINDILDISKIDSGKMEIVFEPVDLEEIVSGVMTTMAGQLKDKPVELITELPDDGLPTVTADSRRVRQVLTNLLGNASKFTEEGFIKVAAEHDDYEVTFRVQDTGIGIPPDRLHAVFEKFEQVDSTSTRRYGGTGLGVPLSREFVRLHGGDMWIEKSVVGEGTTFKFTLPIKGPSAKRPEEEEEVPAEGAERRVVLAVDDDEGVIRLFTRYLEKRGYEVVGMTNSSHVVEEAARLQPYAITLDVIMPGKDGFQLIQELKQNPETQDIPIVVCTIVKDVDKGLSMGVADYLVKPISEQDLLDALTRLEQPKDTGHVLVVDDNPEDRKLLRRILQDAGYTVEEASGGAKAIALIHSDPPNLVVLDLMMPDVDGFAVLENLKSNRTTRDIPVVVVTAKELGPEERSQLQQRVEALLQKGLFDQDLLLQDVESALDRIALNQKA